MLHTYLLFLTNVWLKYTQRPISMIQCKCDTVVPVSVWLAGVNVISYDIFFYSHNSLLRILFCILLYNAIPLCFTCISLWSLLFPSSACVYIHRFLHHVYISLQKNVILITVLNLSRFGFFCSWFLSHEQITDLFFFSSKKYYAHLKKTSNKQVEKKNYEQNFIKLLFGKLVKQNSWYELFYQVMIWYEKKKITNYDTRWSHALVRRFDDAEALVHLSTGQFRLISNINREWAQGIGGIIAEMCITS